MISLSTFENVTPSVSPRKGVMQQCQWGRGTEGKRKFGNDAHSVEIQRETYPIAVEIHWIAVLKVPERANASVIQQFLNDKIEYHFPVADQQRQPCDLLLILLARALLLQHRVWYAQSASATTTTTWFDRNRTSPAADFCQPAGGSLEPSYIFTPDQA